MKNIMKTLVLVMVVVLMLAVVTACNTTACSHEGGTATCSEQAVCEKCGESYGETLAHTIVVREAVEATCTDSGMTEGSYCSVCSEVFAAQEAIPAKGHTEVVDEAVAATCTETGLTEGKHCSSCDMVIVEQKVVNANGHLEINHEGKPVTCTESGWDAYVTCSRCDYTTYAEKAALGHDEVSYEAKAPTCTEIGYDAYVACSRCHYTTYVEKAATGHNIVADAAVDADCTENGLTAGEHCTKCDYKVAQTVVPALGHKDADGNYICDVCKADLCTDHIAQTIAGKAATCTESGLTDGKKCSRCGEILTEQTVIPAKGHSYGKVTYTWSADNSTCTATQTCANDAAHTISATARTNEVVLNVSATKITFTYTVEFENADYGKQTKVVEAAVELVDNIATINAPVMTGKVASHDYVKFGFHDASATYTFTIYYSEVSVWDGVSVSASLEGAGTEEDPFLIQSAADFAYFAGVLNAVAGEAGVNYKVTTFQGQYFKMTKSIDLNGHALVAGAHAGWNNYQGFFGTFDANNCSIRGISINNDTTSSSALFGCIAKGGSVKNLSLYGQINGRVRLGGLAGYLLGSVDNITSYVTLTQAGTGNETGTVGGIIANQENSAGAITNCVNYGSITGESYIFGGIVGSGGATIENCTNWGSVTSGNVSIGGISGSTKDKGTIAGCANYGTIRSTSKEYGKIGGIVGSAVKPIDSCVNYGEVIAIHTAGGIAGDATKEITNCANYGKLTGLSCTSYSLAQITASNVTKTNCAENGSITVPEHNMTHIDALAASCETNGNVEYDYCGVCKKSYGADGKEIANVSIPATGHNYVQGEIVEGKIPFTCTNCGASYTESASYKVTVNHLNLDGSVAASADTLEFSYGEIATINAKTIEGYVASHDYVKVHVLENSAVTIYYSEVSVWDGTGVWDGKSNVATSLDSLGGVGTKADPYIIDEAQDLVTIANIVNSLAGGGSSTLIKDKYFKMTKSIDLNNYPLYIGGFSGWSNRQIFNGHLDGNNCSIRGINNDRALFGCIEGSVTNLSLYGKVYNDKQVGNEAGLVGYLRGQVHYITNYVDVSGHTQVGGVVANLESKTASTHLTNYGTIRSITSKGTWSAAGGVIGCVGYSHSDLVNWGDVYSVGSSAGGIGGYGHNSRAGVITNAYNYGTVYCNYNDKGQILGLIASHTYSNCHENGEVKDLPTEE